MLNPKDITHCSMAGKTKQPNLQDSGKHETYTTGARRDTASGKGLFKFLPPNALLALARHFEEGAKKYSDTECGPLEQNWRKGIKTSRYLDSAGRHLLKALDGRGDEDHVIAAAWNLLCLHETRVMVARGELPPDIDDLPKRGNREFMDTYGI